MAARSATQYASPLGLLTVEHSDDGISRLNWAENGHVENIYPEDAHLKAYFEHGTPIPTNLTYAFSQGTPFQQRVWWALLDISFGETCTYGELAENVGSHARAVGGAVGANPVPILVPCHRVVGKNGSLTGFSGHGGVQSKQWLLEHEAKWAKI